MGICVSGMVWRVSVVARVLGGIGCSCWLSVSVLASVTSSEKTTSLFNFTSKNTTETIASLIKCCLHFSRQSYPECLQLGKPHITVFSSNTFFNKAIISESCASKKRWVLMLKIQANYSSVSYFVCLFLLLGFVQPRCFSCSLKRSRSKSLFYF